MFDIDLFDFSTNTVFEVPDQVKFWDMPQWMAERSIDIVCINSKDGPTLTGNGRINGFGTNICKFVKTESDLDCSYRDLLEHWQENKSQEVIDHGGWDHLPQRYFFKSLSGDRGIVEIMQIDAIEQSVRIKYKLFMTDEEVEEAPSSVAIDFDDPNSL